jgi:hypothetical protein
MRCIMLKPYSHVNNFVYMHTVAVAWAAVEARGQLHSKAPRQAGRNAAAGRSDDLRISLIERLGNVVNWRASSRIGLNESASLAESLLPARHGEIRPSSVTQGVGYEISLSAPFGVPRPVFMWGEE